MPLIYSAEAGTFVEAGTPRINMGGVFCDSIGRIYQDGAWRDVWPTKLWLYREGDECNAVTGGWTGSTVAGTVSKGTDHLYTKMNDFQGPEGVYDTRYAQFYTNQKVNLTHYKYLYIDGYYTGQSGEITFLEAKKNIVYTVVITLKRYFFKNGSRGIIKYDISQLSGEFYIALYALWTSSLQSQGQSWLYNLWLDNK